jgi:hypothetical protein
MRWKLLSLLLTLAALGTALALPADPLTRAQDGTPPPPVLVSDAPRPISRPPLGETFDTAAGWLPDGLWRFEASAGYDGAGWRVDGSRRGMTSTLEYGGLVDLSGKNSAQLVFRQAGSLPETDIVAVELSLDGGQTWVAVDQQFGVEAEWEQRMVDLRFFRGQVVRLRFRVTTGAGAPPADFAGALPSFALDNVALQPFLDASDRIYIPIDTRPRALLGLHLIMGAQGEPVVDLARRLQAIGRPMSTLKGTTGTESILEQVRRVSPDTVLIYRTLLTPDGMQDCPNTANDPVAEAGRWMNQQWPYWSGVTADYFEIMNECHPPMEWMVPFAIEAMRLANERGICLLLFSFAGGNPEPHEYATLAPVYDYALSNPCAPQRYHGVALHAYAGSSGGLLSESGPWMAYRHRKFYELLLPLLPEAYYIPVYITEAGPADGRVDLSCADLARDVVQFTRELERDPYVRGFNWWTVGPPDGTWTDVTPCLAEIGDAVVRYYTGGG